MPSDEALVAADGQVAKSKRQEKKEKRKDQQRQRDVDQPRAVRSATDKYKSFIEQCKKMRVFGEDADVDAILNERYLEQYYPKHYESHGHVVVVQLNQALPPQSAINVEEMLNDEAQQAGSSSTTANDAAKKTDTDENPLLTEFRRFAGAFAKALQTPTDVVVVDTNGIGGELRKPLHAVVWRAHEGPSDDLNAVALASAEKCFAPIRNAAATLVNKLTRSTATAADADVVPAEATAQKHTAAAAMYKTYTPAITFTTHIENKTRYSFDVMRVMFSSGNTEIRMHFGSIDATNETVVDMFSGIGYFTLPLAIHGKPAMIHALEKNPDSATYLQMNAYQNNVADRVTVYCGDNRHVVGDTLDGRCDRVLMGYIPSCKEFVPKALQFLRRKRTEDDCSGETTTTRPCGVVHYHYLAGKDDAEAVAIADITAALPCTGFASDATLAPNVDFRVTRIFQVKSYSPKV